MNEDKLFSPDLERGKENIEREIKVRNLSTIFNDEQYEILRKLSAEEIKSSNLEMSSYFGESNIYMIKTPLGEQFGIFFQYNKTCNLLLLVDLFGVDDESFFLRNLIYVGEKSKAFSLASILPNEFVVEIDFKLKFEAYERGDEVSVPPPGVNNPPSNLIERSLWNVFKAVEPIVMFHETHHAQQREGGEEKPDAEGERDAWAYAMRVVKILKEQGLDLVPGLSNSQQISRIELGLISYSLMSSMSGKCDLYSRRFKNSLFGLNSSRLGLFKFFLSVFKTAVEDPSLVTDTLSLNKRKFKSNLSINLEKYLEN